MGKLNDWRSRRRVRSKTSPKALTAEISRQTVLRLLLLGFSTPEIAQRLNRSPGQIRRMTTLPAFQAEFTQRAPIAFRSDVTRQAIMLMLIMGATTPDNLSKGRVIRYPYSTASSMNGDRLSRPTTLNTGSIIPPNLP